MYVSKQAISKWENDKSLPDLSMYPTIANLLNITIDELMGNLVKKSKTSRKRIIIVSSLFILLITIIVLCLIIIKPAKMIEKNKIINETENILDVKLPDVSTYNIINYNNWLSFNNYMYPHEMYYFIFQDEVIKIDETWLKELPQEIIDQIPIGSSEYPYLCEYYKLVNLTTNTINEISSTDEIHQYVLYCLQIENKRLIAIKFEV